MLSVSLWPRDLNAESDSLRANVSNEPRDTACIVSSTPSIREDLFKMSCVNTHLEQSILIIFFVEVFVQGVEEKRLQCNFDRRIIIALTF